MDSPRIVVVGLGLAGTCITRELWARGIPFVVMHHPQPGDASIAAAGLVNPLAGPKFLPVPQLSEFWDACQGTYAFFESLFQKKFWKPATFVRGFRTEEELFLFKERMRDPLARSFIQQVFGSHPTQIQPLGPWGGYAGKGAILDVAELVRQWEHFLMEKEILVAQTFDASKLELQPDSFVYNSTMQMRRIIFSEGWRAARNPFFDWIPYQPAKGETLTMIGDKAWNGNQIWNQGHWMFQRRPGVFRAGATFSRNEWHNGTTEAARKELLEKLGPWIDPSFEVVGQDWGIRPAVTDHRPFLGKHPELSGLSILNGLGARGSLYAPLLSKWLCDHILDGQAIPESYSIQRFHKHYPGNLRAPREHAI